MLASLASAHRTPFLPLQRINSSPVPRKTHALTHVHGIAFSSSAKHTRIRPYEGTLQAIRRCSSTAPQEVAKRFSFLEWRRSTIERLKQKKALILMEYGTTFVIVHELLGIASYATCFAIAWSGLVTIEDIIQIIGVVPDDRIKDILAKNGGVTTAVTAWAMLKCADWMGLVPLRWFLSITLTPRIAWWLAPKVDFVVTAVRSRLPESWQRKKAEQPQAADQNPAPAPSEPKEPL